MKKIPSFFILLIAVIACSFSAKATHIVGGEIYYDSLGSNRYKITIEIYRDCNSTTPFDSPLDYTIFYADGTIWSEFSINSFQTSLLPVIYDNPCVTPPSDICIERAIYIDTVILPFDVTGYYISYQRCCWAGNIDNIADPINNGITLTTFIPGSSLIDVHNQGARFINYPPLVLCSGLSLIFDHSAFDPDGDSLVYEITTPYYGGSSADVQPSPESTAPYTPVTWNPGFSDIQPFGTGSSLTIDPITGIAVFTPNAIGNFVAGVSVKEYRAGVLINTKIRTFGYRVVACEVQLPLEVDITGPPALIEDCGFAGFIVSRTDTSQVVIVQVLLTGSATNGSDYTFIPDTLIIPTGVFSDTIGISALLDGITEGNETVEFNIVIADPCDGTFDTTSITLTIIDYINMEISTPTDSINLCADFGEGTAIQCIVTNGLPPYTYSWSPGTFPDNDTVTISPFILQPNLNQYSVIVGDQCGKAIESEFINVYNQCPLIVPNVITTNGDNINDIFDITNWEDFDQVSLLITNRWGNVIYQNDDYQNDWTGIDKGGKPISDGVYFYVVTPKSEKYTYDDQNKTLYSLHGFFHVFSSK